jgi:hypothetical protein
MAEESRKFERLPFSSDKGLIGIIIRPESNNDTVVANLADLSKSGLRILTKRSRRRDYCVGESLIFIAIKGTAEVEFKDPVGLEIRWISGPDSAGSLELGCEVVYASDATREKLETFLHSEAKWRGVVRQEKLAEQHAQAPPPPRGVHVEARQAFSQTGPDKRRSWGYWVFLGIVAAALLIAGMFYYHVNALNEIERRLDKLEIELDWLHDRASQDGIESSETYSFQKQIQALADAVDESRYQ